MPRTKLLTIALIVCLVLVLGYTAADINRQSQKRAALDGQIAAAGGILAILPTVQPAAGERLVKARTDYQTALSRVNQDPVQTDVIKNLLELTDRFSFKVNPITTEQWAKRSAGAAIYRILPINFSLEGNLADITRFIALLEDENQYPALEIENTQITPLSQLSTAKERYDTSLQIRISIIERVGGNE